MLTKNKGFTTVELFITLLVLSILVALAADSMKDFVANQKIRATAIEMMSGLKYAQTEAIKRNGYVRFEPNGNGWKVIYTDTANVDKTIQEKVTEASNKTTSVVSSSPSIKFTGDGFLSPSGAVEEIQFNNNNAACESTGGTAKCLKLQIGSGGKLKLCDTAAGAGDVRSCE